MKVTADWAGKKMAFEEADRALAAKLLDLQKRFP